jgi:hypothetical protein
LSTADAAPGDDASQARAWEAWRECIRAREVARAVVAHAHDASTFWPLLDTPAIANDAEHTADAVISAAIGSARDTAPDSWVALHARA